MRRSAVPALALAAAVLLSSSIGALIGGVGEDDLPRVRSVQRTDGDRETTTTTAGGAAAPTDGQASVDAVVPELSAFVERERGLKFKQPVVVKLLDDAAFQEALLSAAEEDAEELLATQGVLQALGLLDDGVDLRESVDQLIGEGVVGFYDDETDALTVRGQTATPYVKLVLVHELTHALDDQHFDLGRDELGDEASAAFSALVEGSAGVIEDRYRESLSRDERRAISKAESEGFDPDVVEDVPEILFSFFGFPYQYGPPLVEVILEEDGMRSLDAAFKDPPVTTEQVLDPDRYTDRDPPVPVDKPAADGAEIQEGEIGQLALFLVLDARVGRNRALEAAQGWGGDRYVAWREGGGTCVRFTTVLDSEEDAHELRSALDLWARDKPRTTVDGTDRVTVTTCA